MTPEEQAAADKAAADQAAADRAAADKAAADAAAAGKDKGGFTPEQIEALKASDAKWNAVQKFFKERGDGALELDLEKLSLPKGGGNLDDDPNAEPVKKGELDAELSVRTSAIAQKIARDMELQSSLTEEIKAEPGYDLIMKHAKAVMDRVPIEKRTEAGWRNAIKMGRGETEHQRRKYWADQGAEERALEILKNRGIALPKAGPTPRTDEELVADLSEAQLREAKRLGMEPKVFAKNLQMIGRGGRR